MLKSLVLKNSIKYILLGLLVCIAFIANAQTNGCYVSSSDRMYYQTPTPGNPTTYFEGAAYYISQEDCTGTGQFFSISSGPSGNNCWAGYQGNGSKTNSAKYDFQGKKATFNLLVCPIDTYTSILLGLTAILGFFFLRRTIVA